MSTPSFPHGFRVGPDQFATDRRRQQEAVERYDDGKGLIGGDPERRPRWLHPLPPPPAQAFRLYESPGETISQMMTALAAAPIEIEIGCGRGEFILDWAAQHPDRRFLAFEVKWKLMHRIGVRAGRRQLTNLWVTDDDARYDLPRLLGAATVSACHILFPDPWWKSKHQTRRLLTPPFIAELARLLHPGGILRLATDVPAYGRAMLDEVLASGAFAPDDPALAAPFAAATPTARQQFCDEIQRPYVFYHLLRNHSPYVKP